MHNQNELVQQYYDSNVEQEWDRLERCPVEYAVTWQALTTHLPPHPAAILDIGGGPGRYALELIKKGYAVSLVDLSPANIDFAKKAAKQTGLNFDHIFTADACQPMPFSSQSFDAILMMGPLYHLRTLEQRQTAIAEAYRLLKPGGIIFAAFITMYGALRSVVINTPENLAAEWRTLQHGVNDPALGFTEAYFARPREILPLMSAFQQIDLYGCEGLFNNFQDRYVGLSTELKAQWLDINLSFCRSNFALEASDHLLFVGKKPDV